MSQFPSFSIVIPTYRRPEQLASCLSSLAQIDYPRELFEVIVVDDDGGQPIRTPSMPMDIKVIVAEHGGPAAARNLGGAHAKGEYLAFTDDDCTADPNWLRGFASCLAENPMHAVGGRTVNALPANPYSSATQYLLDFLYDSNSDPGQTKFFASNNFALPTHSFRACGGFDAGFPLAAGEDREFCDRWARSGESFTYASEAIIFHHHDLTLGGFWRQHHNYGRGAYRVHQLRWEAEGRSTTNSPDFYLRLVTYPTRRAKGMRRFTLTALLALSQVATAAGHWREAVLTRRAEVAK